MIRVTIYSMVPPCDYHIGSPIDEVTLELTDKDGFIFVRYDSDETAMLCAQMLSDGNGEGIARLILPA